MSTSIKPIIFETSEVKGFRESLQEAIKTQMGDDAHYLLNYPVVYIHMWQSATDSKAKRYSIYVGETNDIIERTREHYKSAEEVDKWQNDLITALDENGEPVVPTMFIIGHKYFNKSMTLDVENRFIEYFPAMPVRARNGRGNPQGNYWDVDEFDTIFSSIWRALRAKNSSVFLPETQITKSAIYKVSPGHKLTEEQRIARQLIFERALDAIQNNKSGQLIFVEGDAGTGKTILSATTFYDLVDYSDVHNLGLDMHLMVNNEELFETYKKVANKLGYTRNREDIVCKPTTFINKHDSEHLGDICFIDEGHLLWTQGKQSFREKNQLDSVRNRSRITIVMFDRYQVLQTEQYWETEQISKLRDISQAQGNYIRLQQQMRMNCSKSTMSWLDSFTKDLTLIGLPLDDTGYVVKTYDSPEELHNAIKELAKGSESGLCRLIATYDWKYEAAHLDPENPWCVKIGDWSLPWNLQWQLHPEKYTKSQMREYKSYAWAEQPPTIDEVGSTFTIHGFDLEHAGVILGPSITYNPKSKKIVIDGSGRTYKSVTNQRTFADGTKKQVTEELIQNELRILMTRGSKGLHIYACNPELREALKKQII